MLDSLSEALNKRKSSFNDQKSYDRDNTVCLVKNNRFSKCLDWKKTHL